MTPYARMKIMLITALLFLPCTLAANEGDEPQPPPNPQLGWSAFVRGGFVHQFDTNMDNGGSYSATRFTIQAGLIDRILHNGTVVDFLNVGIGPLRTGIFNIADIAIMGGAVLLLITTIRKQKA
jgi:signal peptidase II